MDKLRDNTSYERIDSTFLLVQQLHSEVILLIHEFFKNAGVLCVDPPILHEQIDGKKGEIYLPLYENRYSLNSSNALYLSAYAANLGSVYSISPTFRDERETTNHLVEFRMLEAEIVGLTYADLPDFLEKLILHILLGAQSSSVVRSNVKLAARIESLAFDFHPRKIAFDQFIHELNLPSCANISDMDPSNIDLEISKSLKMPMQIIDYPRKFASWTAKPKDDTASCAINLMLPAAYGELCEGCERTGDVELLRRKMHHAGIKNLQWYLAAVSRFTGPRCGFGMGIERLICWIAGLSQISDAVLFPRLY